LVAIEQNDVAGFGLLLAQLQTQADPVHLAGCLASLQRVPRAPPAELFFRNALDSCERLIRTPSRASISARRRAIVQFGLSATGSSSKGVTTCNATELLTGSGPGRNRCATAEPCPRARRRPRRCADWSSQPTSAEWRAPCPPRRDHATPQELTRRRAGRRSLQPEICQPCRTCPNRCRQRIAKPIRWSSNQNLLSAAR